MTLTPHGGVTMTAMDVEDVSAATVAGEPAGDETVVAPPVPAVVPELAWSAGEPAPVKERRPLPRSLRLLLATVAVVGIAVGAFLAGEHMRARPDVPTATTVAPNISVSASSAAPIPTTRPNDPWATSAPGQLSQSNKILLDELRKNQVPIPSDDYVVAHADDVCRFFGAAQPSVATAIVYVMRTTIYDWHQADIFMWSSVAADCPEHMPAPTRAPQPGD